MEYISARVKNKYAALADWINEDPLLLKGEIALVQDGTKIRFKVGDGGSNFSALPFVDDLFSALSISVAAPTDNPGPPIGSRVYETTTAGVYTHFLDNMGNPITVNSGEFVHIVDNGSSFVKIVIPLSTGAFITSSSLAPYLTSLYNLDYWQTPVTRTSGLPVDKSGSSFPASALTYGDWYVDVTLSFDLARLKAIRVKPLFAGDINIGLITIDEIGNFVIIDTAAATVTAGTTLIVNLQSMVTESNLNQTINGRAFLAIQNATGQPVRFNYSAPGKQVWEFPGSGGSGYVAKLTNTDVNYYVELFAEIPIEAAMNVDTGITPITILLPGYYYQLRYLDSTIIYNLSGSATGQAILPRFGIRPGKMYVIKFASGTGSIVITAADGALIDGAANFTLTAAGQKARLQFDGNNYWTV